MGSAFLSALGVNRGIGSTRLEADTRLQPTAGQVRAFLGMDTVMVARLLSASAPLRFAQASSERIHAGNPGGRSAGGMGARSVSASVVP